MLRWIKAALTLFATPAFATCQSADAPITGRLAQIEARHPAGGQIKGWVLLTGGVCIVMETVDGDIVEISPRIVHLVFADGEQSRDLWKLAVEEMTARGVLMEAYTAWHLGDIVMLDATIEIN